MSAPSLRSILSRREVLLPGLVAVALGLMAGASAWLSLRGQSRAAREGWELIPVVVAAEELPRGAMLGRNLLAERRVPAQFVTSSVIRPEGLRYVLEQRLAVSLQKGDLLLWSQVETAAGGDRLSSRVLKKARAMTIETGPSSSVGGWIRPNDHVDVIGTFRDPQGQDPVAVTLLENVVVLATGKLTSGATQPQATESSRDYSHVSLLVMPEEVEILVLAAELGSLSLSLRNEADLDLLDERGRADVRTLLSGQRTKDLRERRMRTIQVIKGAAIPGGGLPESVQP